MKIQDYISRHGLTSKAVVEGYASAGEWIACCKNDDCCEDPAQDDGCAHDHFEILGNADNTHIVSINRSKNLFRICHCEMLCMCSEWSPVEQEYQPGAMVGSAAASSGGCGCNGSC